MFRTTILTSRPIFSPSLYQLSYLSEGTSANIVVSPGWLSREAFALVWLNGGRVVAMTCSPFSPDLVFLLDFYRQGSEKWLTIRQRIGGYTQTLPEQVIVVLDGPVASNVGSVSYPNFTALCCFSVGHGVRCCFQSSTTGD